jgi:hypothetical protein
MKSQFESEELPLNPRRSPKPLKLRRNPRKKRKESALEQFDKYSKKFQSGEKSLRKIPKLPSKKEPRWWEYPRRLWMTTMHSLNLALSSISTSNKT